MGNELLLELTSAHIPGALDAIARGGIDVYQVEWISDLTVRFRVEGKYWEVLEALCRRRGDSLQQLKHLGMYWRMRRLTCHWLLILGIVGILLLTAWLPTRVLFIRVEGNGSTSTRRILEVAASCGIAFGADRGAVRSEQVKNRLLDALPELQWAGVNTTGCVAVITVRERTETDAERASAPGHLIALREGLVLEVTAHRGTAKVKPNQAVKAGEMLISGYVDCAGVILFSGAEGEVYAQTRHEISAVTMTETLLRGEKQAVTEKISLLIGKNRINFYEDSGFMDTGCVKMYAEYYLTLPGGFVLPVALLRQTEITYTCETSVRLSDAVESMLAEESRSYLLKQMIAGEILSTTQEFMDGCYEAEYVCREMIGRLVYEEFTYDYGQDH